MKEMSQHQKEFWNNANSRFNIKSGATRSGKTYLDYFMIPRRIRELPEDDDGLVIILGHTRGTIQRNIVDKMQSLYGTEFVSDISSDNTIKIFGRKAYALGADKKNRVDVLRGASFSYVYGDEVATWSPDVFSIVNSRMDKSYSKFDGTCNPEDPDHWLKKFIDTSENVYYQHYSIDDNPFLDPDFVRQLKSDYLGTIFYDRYILGNWTRAEGIIYKEFAGKTKEFFVKSEDVPTLGKIVVGVDLGGNHSKHAFVATGITPNWRNVYILQSRRLETGISTSQLNEEYVKFIKEVEERFGSVSVTYVDSSVPIAKLDFNIELRKQGLGNRVVTHSKKIKVSDRIQLVSRLIGSRRLWYTELAESTKNALSTSLWNTKILGAEERLDDTTTDVDTLDAFEYTIERDARRLMINDI